MGTSNVTRVSSPSRTKTLNSSLYLFSLYFKKARVCTDRVPPCVRDGTMLNESCEDLAGLGRVAAEQSARHGAAARVFVVPLNAS